MRVNPIQLNLSLYAYQLEKYAESVHILSSRTFHF